jgi:predicted nuclease of predicted toxin-antitoxin system
MLEKPLNTQRSRWDEQVMSFVEHQLVIIVTTDHDITTAPRTAHLTTAVMTLRVKAVENYIRNLILFFIKCLISLISQ